MTVSSAHAVPFSPLEYLCRLTIRSRAGAGMERTRDGAGSMVTNASLTSSRNSPGSYDGNEATLYEFCRLMTVTYCPNCATALERRETFGRERPVCPNCSYTHFDDPKVAVGVVAERDGAILMTLRNHEPKLGEWSFPSGYVDAYEDVHEAAVREAREETGLAVTIEHLLGVYQEPNSRVIYLAFAATAGEGEPTPGDECTDVRFFPPDALPPPAFHHDAAIIAAWRRWRDRER